MSIFIFILTTRQRIIHIFDGYEFKYILYFNILSIEHLEILPFIFFLLSEPKRESFRHCVRVL